MAEQDHIPLGPPPSASAFVSQEQAGSGSAESVGALLREIIPQGHRCGPVRATADQMARLDAAFARADAEQAARMPDDRAAIAQMFDAYDRLRKLGWRDAIYCPKDGTTFEVIEPGSTGIHDCIYEGEWPNGSWLVVADGDLWPSRPVLYRPKRATSAEPRYGGPLAGEGRSAAEVRAEYSTNSTPTEGEGGAS